MKYKNGITSLVFLTLLVISSLAGAVPVITKAITQEKQSSLTPKRALELLIEGNQRFLNNEMRNYDYLHEMKVTTIEGQHPIAVVLSCIDSRSIPDVLFDQGLGNLFVARIAGNVVDKDVLGSMEFSTQLAGARLVVVMGHTRCGAVAGACSTGGNTGLKNLDHLLGEINPAVATVKQDDKQANCENHDTIDKITKRNVLNQLQTILKNSSVVSELVKNNDIYLVGAMHDIKTGQVYFFDSQGNALSK